MSRMINVSVLLALQMQKTEIFFIYLYYNQLSKLHKIHEPFSQCKTCFGQLLRFLRIWILSKSNQK